MNFSNKPLSQIRNTGRKKNREKEWKPDLFGDVKMPGFHESKLNRTFWPFF